MRSDLDSVSLSLWWPPEALLSALDELYDLPLPFEERWGGARSVVTHQAVFLFAGVLVDALEEELGGRRLGGGGMMAGGESASGCSSLGNSSAASGHGIGCSVKSDEGDTSKVERTGGCSETLTSLSGGIYGMLQRRYVEDYIVTDCAPVFWPCGGHGDDSGEMEEASTQEVGLGGVARSQDPLRVNGGKRGEVGAQPTQQKGQQVSSSLLAALAREEYLPLLVSAFRRRATEFVAVFVKALETMPTPTHSAAAAAADSASAQHDYVSSYADDASQWAIRTKALDYIEELFLNFVPALEVEECPGRKASGGDGSNTGSTPRKDAVVEALMVWLRCYIPHRLQ